MRTGPTPSPSAGSSSPIPTWSSGCKRNAPLNTPVVETFYGGDAKGYTDYPALGDKAA